MKIFVGIDPGLQGAVGAVTSEGEYFGVWDSPMLQVDDRRKHNIQGMCNIMLGLRNTKTKVVLEGVQPFPGPGAVGMFGLGKSLGLWEGILNAFKIPYETVPPQRWKRAMMNGMGKSKDAARAKAQKLFPTAELNLKKHDGRAEALLMAEWGRLQEHAGVDG